MLQIGSRERNGALAMILATMIIITSLRAYISQAQAAPSTPPPGSTRQFPSEDRRARDAYWALRRGPVTYAEYQNALRQGRQLPQASALPPANNRQPPAVGPAAASAWTSIGPAPIASSWNGGNNSGRMTAIAIDPTTSGSTTTIYVGAAAGGVWKSTNNGSSWSPLSDGQCSSGSGTVPCPLAIGAIAIDPNNHMTIYAGSGESQLIGLPGNAPIYFGDGVLKSTDGGTTWSLLGSTTFVGTFINRIVIDPRNSSNVFVASSNGLYKSTNGGGTFTLVPGPPTTIADDLAINGTTNPSTLYATMRSGGLYRSQDGGVTWNLTGTGLPCTWRWGISSIAIAPSQPSTIYLVVAVPQLPYYVYNTNPAYNGGYYSTDGGNTWSQMKSLNLDIMDQQPYFDHEFAVDPNNPTLVYAGGYYLYYTINAQAASGNWQQVSTQGLHPDQHGVAFAPTGSGSACAGGAYFVTDGGIYCSSSPTSQTFIDLNNSPLAITEFIGGDLSANFTTTKLALAGSQDNGIEFYQGNPIWTGKYPGDGGFAAIDWTNSNYMYSEHGNAGNIVRSPDGGNSFVPIIPPPCTNGCVGLFYTPLALDRLDDKHLIVGTNAVYETLQATTGDPSTMWVQSSQTFAVSVSALAISPNSPGTIYVGLANGTMYKTTFAHSGTTLTYNALTTPANAAFISSIQVDSGDQSSNTVIVTTGQSASTNGGIFLTTNGGTNWTNITGTLPAYPINTAVVYRSGSMRVIVVGTDYGVYFTTNDGGNWQGLSNGLPYVPVLQLALDQHTTTLIAFTQGLSAWTFPIRGIGPNIDTIGVFRPSQSNGTFLLRLHNTTGFADITASFNPASSYAYPVVGDWIGQQVDTVGIFNQNTALFTLCTANNTTTCSNTSNQIQFVLGNPNDIPLSGKWSGSATNDGAGVFRPSNGLIYLKNTLQTGFADYAMVLGIAGDVGLAGDWNGKGYDSPGVYRPTNSNFYLSNQVCNCSVFADYTFAYGVGGDAPVVGDWIGQGHDGVGLFRQSNGFTYLKNVLATGYADISFVYGIPGDIPVAGHWQITYPAKPPPPIVVPPTIATTPGYNNSGNGPGD